MSPLLAWAIRLPVLVISGVMLLSLALVVLLAAFRFSYTDRITPGVTVFGVALDGMTRDEAVALLDGRFTYDETTVFTLRDGDRTWTLTAGELGLAFDVEATVDAALAVGAGDNALDGLRDQAGAWFNGLAVAPIIRYDQGRAMDALLSIAAEIDRDARDAGIRVDGLTVSTTPGQVGRSLDVPATLAQLDNAMLTLSGDAEVPLVVNETLPVVWNVDEAASLAQAALSGPLTLTAQAADGQPLGPWTISTEQIAALLRLEQVQNPDGSLSYVPRVDLSGFRETLATLAPGLITLPEDGRFHFDEATGQLVVIRPSTPGRALDVDTTLARMEQAVFRYDSRVVPLAFQTTPARYHDGMTAAELGIREMVAEATTYFTGSEANRRHNIAEGASRYDGLIIAPGEEFSFNQYLGDVSKEAGFLDGKVIVGGSTVTGVGGGICQVSTTAFRAALNGGYWITERNTHAYRVGYYELGGQPPGLDAAIWSPERDLKFLNDTDHHLLIEVSVYPAQDALQFRFYSTDPGRTVTLEAPTIQNEVPAPPPRFVVNPDLRPGEIVQVDYAADGMDVTIVRRVTQPDGTSRTDRVFTHYLAWQAVYEVAPGDPRLAQNQQGGAG